MSLDKAIKYGKEYREEYRGAKAVDPRCRNHGDCCYCEQNRKHKNKRRMKPVECEDVEWTDEQEN